jgi:hypothetical protein
MANSSSWLGRLQLFSDLLSIFFLAVFAMSRTPSSRCRKPFFRSPPRFEVPFPSGGIALWGYYGSIKI